MSNVRPDNHLAVSLPQSFAAEVNGKGDFQQTAPAPEKYTGLDANGQPVESSGADADPQTGDDTSVIE